MLNFHASQAERDQVAALDTITDGTKIHDLLVSCYTAAHGEDGRPEDVHERRLSDGTCRCGAHGLRRWAVTITEDGGTGRVDTFTWGGTYRHAYSRTAQEMDNSMWEGWSFEISRRPIG